MSDRHRARARLLARSGARAAAGAGRGPPGLEALGEDGCPACNLAEESAARWVAYYIAQGNAEVEVVTALRASLGPCGRHARKLVGTRGGAEVFSRAAIDLAGEALRRAGEGLPRAPCPACTRERWAEDHALGMVADALAGDGAGRAAGLGRRPCLPHRLLALSRAPEREVAIHLAEEGRAALESTEGEELVLRVSGRDGDARARADLLRGAALPARGPRLREWVLSLFAEDACPACLAEREALRELLEWMSTSAESEPWEIRLCAAHLGTLHGLDALTARRVASALAAEWARALTRFAEALREPASAGPLGRRHARAAQGAALEGLLGNRACRACDVARDAGARIGALVTASIQDPELAAAYGRSHGLCFRHLAELPPAARSGLAGEILRARLSLLGWELEEAERKRSWFTRWERVGAEAGAWRRLPGFLGGADAGLAAVLPGADPAVP